MMPGGKFYFFVKNKKQLSYGYTNNFPSAIAMQFSEIIALPSCEKNATQIHSVFSTKRSSFPCLICCNYHIPIKDELWKALATENAKTINVVEKLESEFFTLGNPPEQIWSNSSKRFNQRDMCF